MWENIFLKWKVDWTQIENIMMRKISNLNLCENKFSRNGNFNEHIKSVPSKYKAGEKRFLWNGNLIEHKCVHSKIRSNVNFVKKCEKCEDK